MTGFRIGLIVLVWLGACVSYRRPIPVVTPLRAEDATEVYRFSNDARYVRLMKIVADLPFGYDFGDGAWGIDGTCTKKVTLFNQEGPFVLKDELYADVFYAVMKMHGYPMESQVELFSNSKERVADLQVGGRILELKRNECYPNKPGDQGMIRGSAYLKIEWSVYSVLERKILAVITTEGSTYREIESRAFLAGYLRPALADAVQRLAISARYRAIIDPPKTPAR